MHFTTEAGGKVVKLQSTEKWEDKAVAESLYQKLKTNKEAVITKVDCKEIVEDTPLLYDLTSLQKDANIKYSLTAEQTLSIAQSLYEQKIITYPRTSSRYIPDDVYAEIPKLLKTLADNEQWGALSMTIRKPSKRSVDASKVTDHHALLITGEKLDYPSKEEKLIYDLIVSRMLEAFSEKCIKEQTTITVELEDVPFMVKGSFVKKAGWRFIKNEEEDDNCLPNWKQGQVLPISGWGLNEGKTKPKPILTEAALLSEMESCGKEVEEADISEALKECGIGTPATRANIIETLIAREYMIRLSKQLIPTEKGLFIYELLKDKQIADVAMTGRWEQSLARIEHGECSPEDFHKSIVNYTKEVVGELLALEDRFEHTEEKGIVCPKCGSGRVHLYNMVAKCDNPECSMVIYRQKAGKNLTDDQLTQLLTEGKTGLIKGFTSKQGKKFDANVALDDSYNPIFVFEERENKTKRSKSRK